MGRRLRTCTGLIVVQPCHNPPCRHSLTTTTPPHRRTPRSLDCLCWLTCDHAGNAKAYSGSRGRKDDLKVRAFQAGPVRVALLELGNVVGVEEGMGRRPNRRCLLTHCNAAPCTPCRTSIAYPRHLPAPLPRYISSHAMATCEPHTRSAVGDRNQSFHFTQPTNHKCESARTPSTAET